MQQFIYAYPSSYVYFTYINKHTYKYTYTRKDADQIRNLMLKRSFKGAFRNHIILLETIQI